MLLLLLHYVYIHEFDKKCPVQICLNAKSAKCEKILCKRGSVKNGEKSMQNIKEYTHDVPPSVCMGIKRGQFLVLFSLDPNW